MSLQPEHDLLPTLRAMRDKIERDPAPHTPSLHQLHALLVRRIKVLEAAQTFTQQGGDRVFQAIQIS